MVLGWFVRVGFRGLLQRRGKGEQMFTACNSGGGASPSTNGIVTHFARTVREIQRAFTPALSHVEGGQSSLTHLWLRA